MNSDHDAEKNGTHASPATALATRVFQLPGGQYNSTHLGTLAPAFLYFAGYIRKSTISFNSSLASSIPATSLNVVFTSHLFLSFHAVIQPKGNHPAPHLGHKNLNNTIIHTNNKSSGNNVSINIVDKIDFSVNTIATGIAPVSVIHKSARGVSIGLFVVNVSYF